ncbi:hypothetical protein GC175_08975 [bacterium]|nr:hypothetical protein [bacterium]
MHRPADQEWPISVIDRRGHRIYLTLERWDHALAHPGMHEELRDIALNAVQQGSRKQDKYLADKFIYVLESFELPEPYTHIVVVVKMGWQGEPPQPNNFVLTAYLIQKW